MCSFVCRHPLSVVIHRPAKSGYKAVCACSPEEDLDAFSTTKPAVLSRTPFPIHHETVIPLYGLFLDKTLPLFSPFKFHFFGSFCFVILFFHAIPERGALSFCFLLSPKSGFILMMFRSQVFGSRLRFLLLIILGITGFLFTNGQVFSGVSWKRFR